MKSIIVYSSKGGVGKSTVSVNLAYNLKKRGYRVGICDLDLHAPCIPHLTKNISISSFMSIDRNLRIIPAIIDGVKINSSGYFHSTEKSLVWKSEYEEGAIHQLLEDVEWDVDYLIIDTPPGIHEIHHELIRATPHASLIFVTSPSKISYENCAKSFDFFKKFDYKIDCIVENMAITNNDISSVYYERYFGGLNIKRVCIDYSLELIESNESGVPISLSNTEYSDRFDEISNNIV